MKEKKTYAEAMQRLEQIVAQMQNNETNVDQLTSQLEEAKGLIDFCRSTLTKAKSDAEKILTEMQQNN